DLVGVVDVQPEQVLQPLVAVPAAAVLADLNEPLPDLMRWRIDRDCPSDDGRSVLDEIVTRKRPSPLLERGPPVAVLVAGGSGDRRRSCGRAQEDGRTSSVV